MSMNGAHHDDRRVKSSESVVVSDERMTRHQVMFVGECLGPNAPNPKPTRPTAE